MKDNNSQENKNMEAQASAVVTMTTEEFHKLLEENTRKQNELRTKRQEKLAALHMSYDQSIDAVIDHGARLPTISARAVPPSRSTSRCTTSRCASSPRLATR